MIAMRLAKWCKSPRPVKCGPVNCLRCWLGCCLSLLVPCSFSESNGRLRFTSEEHEILMEAEEIHEAGTLELQKKRRVYQLSVRDGPLLFWNGRIRKLPWIKHFSFQQICTSAKHVLDRPKFFKILFLLWQTFSIHYF